MIFNYLIKKIFLFNINIRPKKGYKKEETESKNLVLENRKKRKKNNKYLRRSIE